MKTKENFTTNDIDDKVKDNLDNLDTMREAQLGNLNRMLNAKEAVYSREQQRLALKYGADHPRVLAVAEKRGLNLANAREVTMERERANITLPDVDEETWLVHGFVRRNNGQGIPDATVAVYDRQGKNWFEDFGYACTDDKGYFKLAVSPLPENPPQSVLPGVSRNQTRLKTNAQPLTPQAGASAFVELIVDPDSPSCPTPQDDPTQTPPKEPPIIIDPGDETAPESKGWIVKGRVTDKSGRGLKGLTVSVYDKDFVFHDHLEDTVTGDDGRYSLTYFVPDFRDFIERKPDLFVVVKDPNGKILYNGKRETRYEAKKLEIIDVQLDI